MVLKSSSPSLLPASREPDPRVKEAVRAILDPIVRVALALHVTANTVTVLGLLIVVIAALLIASGSLLAGALVLMAGSLLDAVDGALARATGGGTPFGGFLDSTLDRAGEAIVYLAIAAHYLQGNTPTWPVIAWRTDSRRCSLTPGRTRSTMLRTMPIT